MLAHVQLYLEIANLSNKSDDQLTEMADKYRASDDTIGLEQFQTSEGKYKERQVPEVVRQREKEDILAKRRGHIRGDNGNGSVIEWMNTYKLMSDTLYAHLFRCRKTMYLLFPYAGPYGKGDPPKEVSLGKYKRAATFPAAGGGGAEALPTLVLNSRVPVASATNIAISTLCSQLLDEYSDIYHIVPCGFSLGAFLATQFTYYWSLSGQKKGKVPCNAVAMAPLPIAPIYTGTPTNLKAAQKQVWAFALVVKKKGEKNIIDEYMLKDYDGPPVCVCTPPANLRSLIYNVNKGTVAFDSTFLDLTLSIRHYRDKGVAPKKKEKLYVASKDTSSFHNLTTYINLAKSALHISIKTQLIYYDSLNLKF